jgi:hypothetical protein
MPKTTWDVGGEEGNPIYQLGEFEIRWETRPAVEGEIRVAARSFWNARHRGKSLKTSRDLMELMDYCETIAGRLTP